MAKGKSNKLYFPEDIDRFPADDVAGGDMAQFDSYVNFDVDTVREDIEASAKSLVVGILDLYLKIEEYDETTYLDAIQRTEVMTLSSLLLNVKTAEHALSSIMRQLDGGGFVQKDIYDTIIKLQKASMEITMQVSQHIRNLPDYFKYIEKEVKQQSIQDAIVIGKNNEPKQIGAAEETESQEEFSMSGPVRGVKDLMKAMRAQLEETKARAAEAEEAQLEQEENIDD